MDICRVLNLAPVRNFLAIPNFDKSLSGLIIKKRNWMAGANLAERVILHHFGLIKVDFF